MNAPGVSGRESRVSVGNDESFLQPSPTVIVICGFDLWNV